MALPIVFRGLETGNLKLETGNPIPDLAQEMIIYFPLW